MALGLFITVLILIGVAIGKTKARVWPENQLTPSRHVVAQEILRDGLSPVHAVDRLRWHIARKEISVEDMKEIMWMLFPEWMEMEKRRFAERKR